MGSGAKKTFDIVVIGEAWGVADPTGFHQTESHRYAPPDGYPFSVCRIDGRQVAVFIEMPVPVEARAELTSRKPEWLAAIVYARAASDPGAEVAVIDAHIEPDDAGLPICGFATACVAFNLGLFRVTPTTYLVRFEGGGTVRVSMEFDDESESWFGEAACEPSPVEPPLTGASGHEPPS